MIFDEAGGIIVELCERLNKCNSLKKILTYGKEKLCEDIRQADQTPQFLLTEPHS